MKTDPGLQFLAGGGALGVLIREHHWAETELGPAQSWPPSLKTVVEILLSSSQPMFLAWGTRRTLIYNDAYAEILASKHPAALGRDFLEVWLEVRQELEPIVAATLRGEPVRMDDIQLQMRRRGFPKETRFAFFYTPLRNENGSVSGLFCACTETTQQVSAARRLQDERHRLSVMLGQMPGFVAMLSGPDFRFEYVNAAYNELVGGRDLVGRTVREALPEVEGQGFFELLEQAYATGLAVTARDAPIRLGPQGEERFVDFLYQPLRTEGVAISGIFVGG